MPCYNFSRAIAINPAFVGSSGFVNVPNNDLTNYPVMFSGTYSWLATVANGGHVQQSSGADIYFASDAAGLNVLPYERAAYSPTTGAVEFHILLPSLSHSVNTVFYIFYGSASAPDLQNITGVWTGYQAVYHFGDGATLSLADSSANGYTLTNHNAVSADAPLMGTGGAAGGSAKFVRSSSQYLSAASVPNIDNITVGASSGGPLLVMGICKLVSDSAGAGTQSRTAIGKYDGVNGWGIQQEPTGQANFLSLTLDGNSVYSHMNDPTGLSYYIFWWVVRHGFNAGYQVSFANGTFQSSTNMATATIAASTGVPLLIGNDTASPYGVGVTDMFWDGNIDEVRIRGTNFPGADAFSGGTVFDTWMRVQINNLIYTNTFYTVGTENSGGPPLTVLPTSEPNGYLNIPYQSVTFTASGGTAPYTFQIDSGALPPGLALNASTGVVSGTPTLAGTYNFVMRAADSSSTSGCGSVAGQIVILSSAVLTISCGNPPPGVLGVSYTGNPSVSGGAPPYTWTITAGALPPGLSIGTPTGIITGTPTTTGSFSFTITVTDSSSNTASVNCQISIFNALGKQTELFIWQIQALPEQIFDWRSQFISHGKKGYHHIGAIMAAYVATSPVTLSFATFDGTAPTSITLPSTGGAYQRVWLNLTFNKALLYRYIGHSAAPFQFVLSDWIAWVKEWGDPGPYQPYQLIGEG